MKWTKDKCRISGVLGMCNIKEYLLDRIIWYN